MAVDVEYGEVEEGRVCGVLDPKGTTMGFNVGVAFWFAGKDGVCGGGG